MPTRLCLEPRCPSPATYRGRCQAHARTNERHTHTHKHLYNSVRWQRTRRTVLFKQPLCECGAIATDVDHVTAIEDGGNPWALFNLQALCASCHATKTNRELRTR